MIRRLRPDILLAAVLALALGGCCCCPTTGKLVFYGDCPGNTTARASAARARAAALPVSQVAAPGVHVSGQPEDGAWAALSADGFRTVVNFRPSSEGADRERDWVAANGMQYFHLPVVGAGFTWGDADALAKILANPSNGKVLLHCSSGNRVSGVWALYQSRYHGLSKDAAIAAGESVGPMRPKTRKRLEEMLGAPPAEEPMAAPVVEVSEEPADATAEPPADAASEQPADEPPEEPADEPVEEPADEPAGE